MVYSEIYIYLKSYFSSSTLKKSDSKLKRSRHSCIVSRPIIYRNKPVIKKNRKKNLSVELCVYDIKRK